MFTGATTLTALKNVNRCKLVVAAAVGRGAVAAGVAVQLAAAVDRISLRFLQKMRLQLHLRLAAQIGLRRIVCGKRRARWVNHQLWQQSISITNVLGGHSSRLDLLIDGLPGANGCYEIGGIQRLVWSLNALGNSRYIGQFAFRLW